MFIQRSESACLQASFTFTFGYGGTSCGRVADLSPRFRLILASLPGPDPAICKRPLLAPQYAIIVSIV